MMEMSSTRRLASLPEDLDGRTNGGGNGRRDAGDTDFHPARSRQYLEQRGRPMVLLLRFERADAAALGDG
jgi:hypothetical protein